MIIKTIVVSAYRQNARVLIDEATRTAMIVDPGDDVERILAAAEPEVNMIAMVVATHGHHDHVAGIPRLMDLIRGGRRDGSQTRLYVDSRDLFLYPGLPPATYMDHMDRLTLGSIDIRLLHTPGHSPGHTALYFPSEQLLISGDALFAGAIGRTDLPGGDFDTLMHSIRTQFFTLPDETRVLSGHGPDTTIGKEKKLGYS